MGEARRKKIAGNTEPNPKYKKNKKFTSKEIQQMSDQLLNEMLFRKIK